MEKTKYSLCLEVLRRMKKKGILDKIMLVGSWCLPLYETYFKNKSFLPPLRTRDIEFLFPVQLNLGFHIDLFELLQDLGFVIDFMGEQGYITFQHPDLIIEFLIPARGKDSDKPYPINELGINAQALRFMDTLARAPIKILFGDVKVNIPHPADFALHKLLIANRRKQKEKAEKDRTQAIALLMALNESNEIETVREIYQEMPKSWQKKITQELLNLGEDNMVEIINKD